MDSFNILPLYKSSPYFKYQCNHSLCNVHIVRELLYLWEVKKVKWAKDISNLLINIYHKQKHGKEFIHKNYQNILKRWEDVIQPTIKNYDKTYNKTKQEKRIFTLEKHKDLFLKFSKEKEVSFDNNQMERDLRIIKVKQKVSGCFRQDSYVSYFAIIRSYMSTLKKINKIYWAILILYLLIKTFSLIWLNSYPFTLNKITKKAVIY
ncbi:MAG: IS66 family transposase [Polaribacter sp.]